MQAELHCKFYSVTVHFVDLALLNLVFYLVRVFMGIASPPKLPARLGVTLQNDMEIKSRATPGSKGELWELLLKMCLKSTFWTHLFVCICFFSHEHYQYRSPVMDDHYLACLRLATSCYCYDYEKLAASSQYQQSHCGREWANFKLGSHNKLLIIPKQTRL